MEITLKLGDCIEVLKTIPDNSIDSIVTDPPYGIGFMNKEWDNPQKHQELIDREKKRSEERYSEGKSPAKAGFSTGVQPGLPIGGAKEGKWFQDWCELWARECYRVLKPGGHALSFSAPRTYHRMATAFEDVGFQIRDQIMWVFGSGFPKSLNIGKAIDKLNIEHNYDGYGTALKPAHEPIVLARKPLSEKSIVENVLKHGTGGINIDGSRIGTEERTYHLKGGENLNKLSREGRGDSDEAKGLGAYGQGAKQISIGQTTVEGRFPANIIFDEEAGQLLDKQSGISKSNKRPIPKNIKNEYEQIAYGKRGDIETIRGHEDTGGASRFFYCPKTSKKDRNEGLDVDKQKNPRPIGVAFNNESDLFQQTTGNNHPTVKPTDLMRYLINLVTPKGGTTLDPFMGSGSTGKAAIRCGVNFIGIEKEEEYLKIGQARIDHELNKPKQQSLF